MTYCPNCKCSHIPFRSLLKHKTHKDLCCIGAERIEKTFTGMKRVAKLGTVIAPEE